MSEVIKVHLKDTPDGEIHHIPCPPAELRILKILEDKEMTGPQISRASDGLVSIPAVYKLLIRLKDRELVTKRNIEIPAADIVLKQVAYSRSFDSKLD